MFTDEQILGMVNEAGLNAVLLSKGVYKINGSYINASKNINTEVKDLIVSDRKGLKCKISGTVKFNGETYIFNNDRAEVNILKRSLVIKSDSCTYEYSLKTNKIIKK